MQMYHHTPYDGWGTREGWRHGRVGEGDMGMEAEVTVTWLLALQMEEGALSHWMWAALRSHSVQGGSIQHWNLAEPNLWWHLLSCLGLMVQMKSSSGKHSSGWTESSNVVQDVQWIPSNPATQGGLCTRHASLKKTTAGGSLPWEQFMV